MTTSRTRMQATLLGAAVALAFTNAGAAYIDLTGGYNVCGTTNGATVCSANNSSGSTGSSRKGWASRLCVWLSEHPWAGCRRGCGESVTRR
jgi:hypothetical protein